MVKGYSHQQLREMGLNHEVSGESTRISQNTKLKKGRIFYLSDGSSVFFENHVKLSKGFRIHFFPGIWGQTLIIIIKLDNSK